jgi:uncharacterized protein with HEPN domain
MVEMAEAMDRLTREHTLADFMSDEGLNLAVVRAVEVFGEAAARIDPMVWQAVPQVPWRKIIATRNRLAHAYFDIDESLVWTAATRDVPALLPTLRRLLAA